MRRGANGTHTIRGDFVASAENSNEGQSIGILELASGLASNYPVTEALLAILVRELKVETVELRRCMSPYVLTEGDTNHELDSFIIHCEVLI